MSFDSNQLRFMLEAIKYPGITSAFIFGTGLLCFCLPFLPCMKRNILNLVVFALGSTLILTAFKIFEFSTQGIAPEIRFIDLTCVVAFSGADFIGLAQFEEVNENKKSLVVVGLLLGTVPFLLYLLAQQHYLLAQQPASVEKRFITLRIIAYPIGLWLMQAEILIAKAKWSKLLVLVGSLVFLLSLVLGELTPQ